MATTKTLAKAGEETADAREFLYNGSRLEDFDKSMSEEDVKKFYEQHFPELTTANPVTSFEDRDGKRIKIITFKKAAGTKG